MHAFSLVQGGVGSPWSARPPVSQCVRTLLLHTLTLLFPVCNATITIPSARALQSPASHGRVAPEPAEEEAGEEDDEVCSWLGIVREVQAFARCGSSPASAKAAAHPDFGLSLHPRFFNPKHQSKPPSSPPTITARRRPPPHRPPAVAPHCQPPPRAPL